MNKTKKQTKKKMMSIFFHLDVCPEFLIADYVSSDFFLVTDKLGQQIYQISSTDRKVSAAQMQDAARPDLVIFNSATGEIIWLDSDAAAIKSSFLNGTSVRLVKSMQGKI